MQRQIRLLQSIDNEQVLPEAGYRLQQATVLPVAYRLPGAILYDFDTEFLKMIVRSLEHE